MMAGAPQRRPLALRLLPALALLAAACGGKTDPPSILLLTLDTTRSDALSCYSGWAETLGHTTATTPNIDRIAAEGMRFDSAFTSTPLTLPAHTSILTGLYPIRHGIRNNGMGAVPDAADTLAERARREGYQTAAFVGAVVLDEPFGLGQGFDAYGAPIAADPTDYDGERPAREVVDDALAWLDARDRERPFLLWLHFYDPHTPYNEPDVAGCEHPAGDRSLRAIYLREVCAMDREIGRVFDRLDAEGEFDRAIVMAIGDHGEAFGEHGEDGHTAHVYDTTLRVPLLVRLPGGERGGTVRSDVVSVVDVLPSLVATAGWGKGAGDLDGLALLDAEAPADRGVYFESYYGYLSFGWSPLAGWLDRDGKYVHSSEPAFYDLARDPNEDANEFAARRADVRRYELAISDLAERTPLPREDAAVEDDVLDSLRGLGYVSVGTVSGDLPHPLETLDLPSPERMIEFYELTLDAVELAQADKSEEALAILERVVAANPKNPFALGHKSGCELRLGKYEQAEQSLRALIACNPTPEPAAYFRLGACLRALGRHAEAIEPLETAVRMKPDRPRFLRELIGAFRDADRRPEAIEYIRKLQALEE